ncbi:dihydrofolate reductase [Clostridium aminobutyricum]|uniref:dihydrofolate reductase n=1 Tax=Clostridium aminobutyricum TaxID=33953 RepID=A0A939IJT5_CLOAM|nr:dihydrofolate reductase [Clostridium aminobutyricum]MBN7774431.1 dihydrofolate reductase [Clostridium aminobutyricum]
MKIIVAADRKWGIGKDNNLLTHLPGDLKYFKEMTLGKVVVMGRKTLESLPGKKPLPGRTNIVLSGDKNYKADCLVCHSEEELAHELEKYDTEDIYIIGGAKVYADMRDCCDTYYVTKILDEFDADRHFENLDLCQDVELVWESELQEHNGTEYKFTEYRRK